MFCPDCGNDCGNARFCSACGRELIGSDDSSVVELLGTYQGLDGYIEVDFFTVTIHKYSPSGPIVSTLLHDDISNVEFSQASGEELGYLALRDKKHDALVTAETDAIADNWAILFNESSNDAFTEVFRYLSQLTRKWARDHRGPNKWKPLYIRQFSICPRCGSTRRLWYSRRRIPGNKHSSYIQVFECLKCELKMEW